jgi:hypothetical protein
MGVVESLAGGMLRGETTCLTCPLLAPDEREHRFRAEIEAASATVAVT